MTFHTGTVTSQIPSAASMSNIPQALFVRTNALRDVTQQSFTYLFIVYINGVSSPCCIGVELMNCKGC